MRRSRHCPVSPEVLPLSRSQNNIQYMTGTLLALLRLLAATAIIIMSLFNIAIGVRALGVDIRGTAGGNGIIRRRICGYTRDYGLRCSSSLRSRPPGVVPLASTLLSGRQGQPMHQYRQSFPSKTSHRFLTMSLASSLNKRAHEILADLQKHMMSSNDNKDKKGGSGQIKSKKMSTSTDSKKRVVIPIGNGSEELETISISDTLVRAGCDVKIVSVSNETTVVCAREAIIQAHDTIDNVQDEEFDAIICPGGMPGASNLASCDTLTKMLHKQYDDGRIVAAICASPAVVLAPLGFLDGKVATCFPGRKFADAISQHGGRLASKSDGNVIVDGNIVTSMGPGTALEFALQLSMMLCGESVTRKVCDELLVPELHDRLILPEGLIMDVGPV
jgi:4-methyl-5(b-hydroxyethyl)-thiazole monophosphate biosynthesis